MRASIALARAMPEGTRYKALKCDAEVVDGDVNDLLLDLTMYRYALQRVVDALWVLDKVPKRSQVHQLFHSMLRSYGFRAHVARNAYDAALALVRAAKECNSSKPIVKRTAPIMLIYSRDTSRTCPRYESVLPTFSCRQRRYRSNERLAQILTSACRGARVAPERPRCEV